MNPTEDQMAIFYPQKTQNITILLIFPIVWLLFSIFLGNYFEEILGSIELLYMP